MLFHSREAAGRCFYFPPQRLMMSIFMHESRSFIHSVIFSQHFILDRGIMRRQLIAGHHTHTHTYVEVDSCRNTDSSLSSGSTWRLCICNTFHTTFQTNGFLYISHHKSEEIHQLRAKSGLIHTLDAAELD